MLPASALQPTLKKGAARIYGVLGDSYLQNRVISAILTQFLDADARDFNLDTIRGNNSSVSEVLSLCANMPFLAERRAVVVTEIEKLEQIGKSGAGESSGDGGGDGDDGDTAESAEGEAPKLSRGAAKGASAVKTLGEGLKNLPASTLLILARTPETPDVNARKKERRLINAALDKIIEGASGGVIFDCTIDPNNSSAAVKLLQEEARQRGIEVAPPIANQLVERCGTDLQLLINELEKCALFAGQGPITSEVVAEMTQPALHNTTFDLIDAVIDRRGAPAIEIVRQLFAANISPEQLLGQLIGHLRLLFQARALLDCGVSDGRGLGAMAPNERAQFPIEGMVALLGNPSQKFRANKMLTQARRMSISQIQSALEMAFETDLALKGVVGDGGFLPAKNASRSSLEILIARLCGK